MNEMEFVESLKESTLLPGRIETLWGQRNRIRPAFCADKMGDGKLPVVIWTINDRPKYYLIFIDSAWHDGTDFVEDFDEEVGEILETIEEQFGNAHFIDDNGRERVGDWPMLNDWNGYGWYKAEAGDFVTPNALKTLNRKQNKE